MISVVTITFNNFEDLQATLGSVKAAPAVESIVINGGSCSKSRELLSHHSGIVVSEPDRGISDAFNKGVARATGSGVAFLNSGDVLVDATYYSRADVLFKEDPGLSFVYADLEFLDEVAGPVRMRPRGNTWSLGRGLPFPHPTMVVRKRVFEEVGPFSLDFRIAMDFDFVVRMLRAGHRGRYLPGVVVRMDGSGVSSVREEESLRECRRSLELQGLFGVVNRMGYFDRAARLWARRRLMTGPGRPLLVAFKRLKSLLG